MKMKACAIQTPFCTEFDQSEAYFGKLMDYMDACDESMDLIVLPEYSNVPCSARTKEEAEEAFARFGERLMEKAKETAVRCGAVVCVCGLAR
jgi:predicted amidohydrolase